jgi:hypothetical protein
MGTAAQEPTETITEKLTCEAFSYNEDGERRVCGWTAKRYRIYGGIGFTDIDLCLECKDDLCEDPRHNYAAAEL